MQSRLLIAKRAFVPSLRLGNLRWNSSSIEKKSGPGTSAFPEKIITPPIQSQHPTAVPHTAPDSAPKTTSSPSHHPSQSLKPVPHPNEQQQQQQQGSDGHQKKAYQAPWGAMAVGVALLMSLPVAVGLRARSDELTRDTLRHQLSESTYDKVASVFKFPSAPTPLVAITPPTSSPHFTEEADAEEKQQEADNTGEEETTTTTDTETKEEDDSQQQQQQQQQEEDHVEKKKKVDDNDDSSSNTNNQEPKHEDVSEQKHKDSSSSTEQHEDDHLIIKRNARAILTEEEQKEAKKVLSSEELEQIVAETISPIVARHLIALRHENSDQEITERVKSRLSGVSAAIGHYHQQHESSSTEAAAAENLKQRVKELLAIINDWSRAEGVRMTEALRHQQQMDEMKYAEIISQYQTQMEETLKNKIESLIRERDATEQKSREELFSSYADRTNETIASIRNLALNQLKQEIEEREIALESKLDDRTAEIKDKLSSEYKEATQSRIEEMERLAAQVLAFNAIFNAKNEDSINSHRVHQLSLATLALAEALNTKRSFQPELKFLKQAANGDELVETVVNTIPETLAEHGTATYHHLVSRFDDVAKEGKRVALVPGEGGMVPEAIGTLLAKIPMMKERGFPEGEGADVTFDRAQWYLQRGHLFSAVAELEKLKGRPLSVAQGWIAEAKERLIVDQSIMVIRAHIASLVAAMC